LKTLRIPLLFAIAFIAQITLADLIAIKGYKIDMILILMTLVLNGLGCYLPIFAGFGLGLLQDLLGGGLIGLNALSKSLVGFILGQFYPEKNPRKSEFFLLVSALCIIVHDFVYNYIYGQGQGISILGLFFKRAFPSSLYNLTLVFFITLLPFQKRRRK
jgi:rod shape-determining protein MreD